MNKPKIEFKKKLIATTIASYAFAGLSGVAMAQSDTIEDIVVTGIKGSLQRSADIKRESQGVVDAISAEDMGKFPDTNLAESLQRISGVSINRANGEGQQITVRGLGPNFNLVLLNGRQMPTAGLQETVVNSSRSFDFSNLASESVSAVEVYKTSNAGIPTGGMGATVNIKTTRPLDNPGMHLAGGVKGVIDESSDEGDDITPEVSGLYSQTFADDKVGVSLAASFQERHGGFAQAGVLNGWYSFPGSNTSGWGGIGSEVADLEATDIYSRPQNFEYSFGNFQRERTNAQLTLQFSPIETITGTLDYTYTEQNIATERNNMSVWFDPGEVLNNGATNQWTDGPVSGPAIYSTANGADLVFAAGQFAQKNENNSVGLNLEWQATDKLAFELDFHDSDAESKADSPYGNSSVLSMATFERRKTTVDFTRDFPVLSVELGDSGSEPLDASDLLVTGSSLRNSQFKNEIQQIQLKGNYEFDAGVVKSIDFGVASTENSIRAVMMTAQRDTWGGEGTPANIPDDIFTLRSVTGDLGSVSTEGATATLLNNYFTYDFEAAADAVAAAFGPSEANASWPCGPEFCVNENWTTDQRTGEEYVSAFVQTHMSADVGNMTANLSVGIRYEETDITSSAMVPAYTGIDWVADNEFGTTRGDGLEFTNYQATYDHVLPSVDFNIEVIDNVVLRASYSETIARPTYNHIAGGVQLGTLRSLTSAAGRGDPTLLPHESKNIDLSAEWYFDDASYVSLGYFHKTVDNFVGNSTVDENLFGLTNPSQGPRQRTALAALGNDASLAEIRDYIFANYPESTTATGVNSNGNVTGQIHSLPEDDFMMFEVTVPVNEKTARIDGLEFAVQHTLENGFGAQFNYTMVDSDAEYDITSMGDQFAMPGLSDTTNVVAFYDNNGLQVRLAYNWRDEFFVTPNFGNGQPMFNEEYSQWDLTASYEVLDGLTIFVEGINITDETQRLHGRSKNELIFAIEQGPRYNLGARYTF